MSLGSWIRDPGSGILENLSRIQGSKRHRIPDPDPQHREEKVDTISHLCKQCCGSGMFIRDPGSWLLSISDPRSRIPDLGSRIPDPGSRISDLGSRISDPGSRIPDPGSRIPDLGYLIPDPPISDPQSNKSNERRGPRGEKFVVLTFLASNLYTIEIYCIFWQAPKEKNWSQFHKTYCTYFP
jgi:hypothetical protein